MCFATGSSSAHLPSSQSIIMATPTIGLVIEASLKIVSLVTGFFVARSCTPYASRYTTLPCRATSVVTPASLPSSTSARIVRWSAFIPSVEKPTDSGEASRLSADGPVTLPASALVISNSIDLRAIACISILRDVRVATDSRSFLSADDEGLCRGGGAALLEPVDTFADQIELQGVAARLVGYRDFDGDLRPVAGAERLRQPGACVVAIEHRAVGGAELGPEADEAAAVGGLGREGARRQVPDARADLQGPSFSSDEGHARHQRANVNLRARHGAGN